MLKCREKAQCWDTLLMTAALWGKVEFNRVIPGSVWATLECDTQDSEVCIITPQGRGTAATLGICGALPTSRACICALGRF